MDAHLYHQYQTFRHQLNKLQAHKSSFQAWKCVSFGYALLATVLLSAKWHEVSTDLRLLNGIDQLLWQTTSNSSLDEVSAQSALRPINASSRALGGHADLPAGASQWGPAAALLDFLSTSNSSSGDPLMASATGNSSSMLVSHMQMSLGRELNGNQLLKQEVETFLAEFRSAKSTLSLSSLLVFVYIISWVLMTMAVNDTRISNDISLRNILLLSVFGAIDMAASIGFVMVRLIMYNVKSNTTVADILGSASLKDAPLRLSSDQLTAFTALRLIAMRSCSAYIDVYVSVLVALLTVLRFYAIVRAIAYYRFLRRFNDLSRNLHHHHQLTAAIMGQTSEKQHMSVGHHQQPAATTTTLQGFVSQNGAGADLMRAPANNHWRAAQKQQLQQQQQLRQDLSGPTMASAGLTVVSVAASSDQCDKQQAQARLEQQQLLSPSQPAEVSMSGDSVVARADLNGTLGYKQKQLLAANEAIGLGRGAFYNDNDDASPGELRATAKAEKQRFRLIDMAMAAQNAANLMLRTSEQQVADKTLIKAATTALNKHQQQHHHQTVASRQTSGQRPALFIVSDGPGQSLRLDGRPPGDWRQLSAAPLGARVEERATSRRLSTSDSRAPPDMLMVNGRPHRLIAASNSEFARRRRHLNYESSGGGPGFESEPVAPGAAVRQRSRSRDAQTLLMPGRGGSGARRTSEQVGGQHASYTLLSASQLDRLSRKLLANATGSLAQIQGRQVATRLKQQQALDRSQGPMSDAAGSSARYKLIARYRPVSTARREPEVRRQQQIMVQSNVASRQQDQTELATTTTTTTTEDEESTEDLTAGSYEVAGAEQREPPTLASLLASHHRHQRNDDKTSSGASSSSSSSSPSTHTDDSDDAPTARIVTPPESAGAPRLVVEALVPISSDRRRRAARAAAARSATVSGSSNRRRQHRPPLASLRQTEEVSLEPAAIAPATVNSANRDLLLEKYYYA